MRPFIHAWELDGQGWRNYAKLPLFTEGPLIWGVSYEQILLAERSFGFFSPDQFLELVKSGIFRVAARHAWYSGSKHRDILKNKGYKLTDWNDDFDGTIAKLSEESGVILLGDDSEIVNLRTEKVLNSKNKEYDLASDVVTRKSKQNRWLESSCLRIGKGNPTRDELIRFVVSSSIGHNIALEKTGCNASVDFIEDPVFLGEIGGGVRKNIEIDETALSINMVDALYSIAEFNRNTNSEKNFSDYIDNLLRLKDLGLTDKICSIRDDVFLPEEEIKKLHRLLSKSKTKTGGTTAFINYVIAISVEILSLYSCMTLFAREYGRNMSTMLDNRLTRREFIKFAAMQIPFFILYASYVSKSYRDYYSVIREKEAINLNSFETATVVLMGNDSQNPSIVSEEWVEMLLNIFLELFKGGEKIDDLF